MVLIEVVLKDPRRLAREYYYMYIPKRVYEVDRPSSTLLLCCQGGYSVGIDFIQDSVVKVKLPANLKLSNTTTGVKLAEQSFVNVIKKCGRYADLTVKLFMSNEISLKVSDDTYQTCSTLMSHKFDIYNWGKLL